MLRHLIVGLVSLLACLPPASGQTRPAEVSVTLPLQDLRALLDPRQPDRAPVDHVFGPATYTLNVGDKSATLSIETQLSFPNRQWVLVPLGKATGATAATLNDQPAAITRRGEELFAVVDAREMESASLKLTAELPVRSQGEVNWLTLPLIPSQMGTLKATLAAPNLAIKAPDLLALKADTQNNTTVVTATLPHAEAVRLQWSPRDARPARVSVQHLNHTVVDRGVIRYTATLQYEILRSPVESLAIALPDGVEVTRVTADAMNDYSIDDNARPRVLTVALKEPTQGSARVVVEYEQRLQDDQLKPAIALLKPLEVAGESGFVGVEVRGNYEVAPEATGADRLDLAQLPDLLWSQARSPLRFGYRFDKPGAALTLTLRPLQDLDVLIAMSDVSEVSTTVTPEGKVITKAIMIVRNNQKSHLRVSLPQGAQLWSAFVDDRPVTPAKDEKGEVLIPLRKSEAVDMHDQDNYINRRDQRRNMNPLQAQRQQLMQLRADDSDVSDLKPYDVELVYITPDVKLDQRGSLQLALPKVDIPIGRLAWAVFLPSRTRIVDVTGNMREVDAFSLPFRHFAEEAAQQLGRAQDQALEQMVQAAQAELQVAPAAKAKGVLPVRIEVPIAGQIHRFEKMLTVDEAPAVELTYVRRD
jgi:hypothetical protein